MFLNVCKQTFHISHMSISRKVKGVLMSNLQHYVHMKAKILADFQICISVPLRTPLDGCFWGFINENKFADNKTAVGLGFFVTSSFVKETFTESDTEPIPITQQSIRFQHKQNIAILTLSVSHLWKYIWLVLNPL